MEARHQGAQGRRGQDIAAQWWATEGCCGAVARNGMAQSSHGVDVAAHRRATFCHAGKFGPNKPPYHDVHSVMALWRDGVIASWRPL